MRTNCRLKGIIVQSNNKLLIDGCDDNPYTATQKGVLIKDADITKFNLKIGDKVLYGNDAPYEIVNIYAVESAGTKNAKTKH